jgi:hypothetical protein
MIGLRILVLAAASAAVAGCMTSLPTPDYVSVKTPPPYRTAPGGTRIDNEDYAMDAQGYRVDQKGERVGEVDVDGKMGNQTSNAMAGFYVSSMGADAPGRIMAPSEGAAAGAGYGPGSAGATLPAAETLMPQSSPPTPAPASGAPVPLAPPTK